MSDNEKDLESYIKDDAENSDDSLSLLDEENQNSLQKMMIKVHY